MAKRPKIGHICEIPTAIGLAYFQFTHKHWDYGYLIRVFEGAHPKRPEEFGTVAAAPVQFSTFFPLGTAVNRKVVEIVAHESVRGDLQEWPVFRSPVAADFTKPAACWYLWTHDGGSDGKRLKKLTAAQRKMPILSCWNDGALIDAIETGWRAETSVLN
jgi:hypothetical protein